MNRAVEDGAVVPVYFEPRLIPLKRIAGITDDEIDDTAEEVLTGLDEVERDRIQRSVAALEIIYGSDDRLDALAEDFVRHWEDRRENMREFIGAPGKAMIVTVTRSIAARLYSKIVALRPEWHSDADDKGKIKVIYSAAPSDPDELKVHMRRPSALKAVKNRIKDVDDELEIAIVQSMMLTGFDAPPLHTLYIDRSLKSALLMQTLARVNRTFRDKQDGLLVAYAPLVENLEKALAEFTLNPPTTVRRSRDRTSKKRSIWRRDSWLVSTTLWESNGRTPLSSMTPTSAALCSTSLVSCAIQEPKATTTPRSQTRVPSLMSSSVRLEGSRVHGRWHPTALPPMNSVRACGSTPRSRTGSSSSMRATAWPMASRLVTPSATP